MGDVRVNSRTVVTRKSEGVSFASGDVCVMPDGGGPVPFVNVARSADATNEGGTVRANGVPIVVARSSFARSTGDEAGADGGVISGTTQGPAVFTNYSFDVRIQGQPVPRALDPMVHNLDGSGVPNASSPAELQTAAGLSDKEILCAVVCACNWRGGKTACVRKAFATPVYRGGKRYWDPRQGPPGYPTVYVEVPYRMFPKPWPVMGKVPSQTLKDKAGNPLLLPRGDLPPIRGTRRPDIVVVKDPTRPPTPDNIKDIYEVKFPPDDWRPGQERAYQKIAGKDPIALSPAKCGCKRDQKLREVPLPVPVKEPVKQEDPRPEPIPYYPSEPNAPQPITLPSVEPIIVGVLLGLLGILLGGLRPRPTLAPAPGGVPMLPGESPRET